VWEITLACDLNCRHCGSRAGDARPDELTTAECLDLVEQLAEAGVREVTLIGGEAYLREDWTEIAAAITAAGMKCGMTTGGRGLDRARVDAAAEAGISVASISIDGLRERHDAQRGMRGSWDSAVEAARLIADSPIQLGVNTQVNRLSMPDLGDVADLLVELEAVAWQVQITVPMGNAADRPELLLQPWDLLELMPLLVWLKKTKLEPAGVELQPGNNVGYFGPYERWIRRGGEQGAHWAGCYAGHGVLGLEADGKIKGCPSLPSDAYTGLNIRDGRLAEALETRQLRGIRQRTVEDDLWGFCRDCYYAETCMAGCTWTSHCLMGKPGNNPYCSHRAIEFEKQGLRERIVRREAAPGVPFDHGAFDLIVEPLPDRQGPTLVELLAGGGALPEVDPRDLGRLLQRD
jgi:radical SAM protein with 4Fe4S-binding SPASM domain